MLNVNNFFREVILSFRQCKKRRNVEIGPVIGNWIKRWTAWREHPLTNGIACGWVDDLALGQGFLPQYLFRRHYQRNGPTNRFRHGLGNGSFVPCTTLGECSTDISMQIKNGS
jgi:hypothetical protein